MKTTIPFQAVADDLKRSCSKELIHSVDSWIPETLSAANYTQFNPSDIWQARIDTIVSEASYLGFTRLLRLCRAIQTSLNVSLSRSSVEGTAATHKEVEALACAWLAVRGLVLKYEDSQHIDVASEISGLKEAFYFTDVEVQNCVSISPIDDTAIWMEKAQSQIALDSSSHVDTSVYRSDWIDTLDKCMEEETWIVSQLVSLSEDLAAGAYVDRPAHKLLNVLRRHRFFNRVDRVCMAGRVNNTNQLVVLDSSNSTRGGENTLKKGYSCFVNPVGSLFKMKPSTIRIFGECNRVLAAFAEQRKPAQRSMAFISDLGLRSGLCMSIGRGDSVQGFLFLNSQEPGLFDEIKERFAPLLSLFAIVTKIAMDANGFHTDAFHSYDRLGSILPRSSIPFEENTFGNYLRDALLQETNHQYCFSITSNVSGNHFLYVPQTVVGILSNIFARIHFPFSDTIDVTLHRIVNQIVMDVRHPMQGQSVSRTNFIQRMVDLENTKLRNLPVSVEVHEDAIRVKIPYEPTLANSPGQFYSIAY